MFWQAATFSKPSPIEQILEKESFSLAELLDEDDLIQEAKSLNGRLVEFLKQPETVSRLVSLIVAPPPGSATGATVAGKSSQDAKEVFKFPYVACEVFCCEVEPIMATLVGSKELLSKFFSILDLPGPLDCVRAGYFARVLQFLFLRRWGDDSGDVSEIMDHLEKHPEVLLKMVAHVETTSIAESLLRLLGGDEAEPSSLAPSRFSWIAGTPVLEDLLQQLGPTAALDAQQNAAFILSAIARSHLSPLARSLAAPPFLGRLIECALAPDVSILALDICIALLDQKAPQLDQQEGGMTSGADSPLLNVMDEAATKARAAAIQEMVARLGRLKEILQAAKPPDKQLATPYGVLAPPLGTARLKAVELVAALVHTGDPVAEQGLAEHGLLVLCLDLFLQFPFNNLLHHLVTGAVCFILEHGSSEALAHLLQQCNLVPWLVGAPEEVESAGPREPGGRKLRAGYLGHLTHIANRLAEAATVRDAVAAALGAAPGWGAWVEGTLRSRNETEDVLTWACGRPSNRAISVVASVDELDDDSSLQEMESFEERARARYADQDQDLGQGRYFFSPRGFSHGAESPAAFRLPADSLGFDAGSSSSSSSDDDEPFSRPVFSRSNDMSAAFRSGVTLDSSSSSSSEDEMPVMQSALPEAGELMQARSPDDQASMQATLPKGREEGTGNESEAHLDAQEGRWLAFGDPTDSGWAAFPHSAQAEAAGTGGNWDPFGQVPGDSPKADGAGEQRPEPPTTQSQ